VAASGSKPKPVTQQKQIKKGATTDMTCYHPLKGWKSRELTSKGKRKVVFQLSQGYQDMPMEVPCGQCIGCRLERSRQWAIRCSHEASLHQNNCFITLTYDNKHLPKSGSLTKTHFQKFMKRLRKKFGKGVRYYQCGEYGEQFHRPHYHACLFNFDFPDKTLWKQVRGNKLYHSPILQKIWGKGFCSIGEVTFESAAYVARYITKKINGDLAEDHYSYVNAYGEIKSRQPEYTTMSRKPGIGKNWLEKYITDVYPSDFVVMRNKKMRPPRYYDSLYEIKYPEFLKKIKNARKREGLKHSDNNTYERLKVREEVQLSKFKQLKRSYENET